MLTIFLNLFTKPYYFDKIIFVEILKFLNKNRNLYIPVIEAIERGEAEILNFDSDGAVVKQGEYLVNMCLRSDKALLKYRELVENYLCVIFDAKDLDYIAKMFPGSRQTPCIQVIYTKKEPPVIQTNAEFKLLDRSYAQFVYDTYSRRPPDISSIIALIDKKYIYGIFIDGEIAGFCGRHYEGSMGLLEILPQFRRQGLGRLMEKFIISQVLKEGRTPYGHVVFGNDISLNLQLSIDGMIAIPETVLWQRVLKD